MKRFVNIKKCRLCKSKRIKEVLKIKPQYIATTFVKDNGENPMSKVKIPMTAVFCEDCHLVQLKETVNPELLYTNYFYRTSINDTMRRDLRELVDRAQEKVNLKDKDWVVDIGSNDGTMISMFPDNLNRVGIEPAKNIDWSHLNGIKIVNEFFSKEAAQLALKENKAKVITSTAMFYDISDPVSALKDIKDILHEDGVAVIQVSHLLATIKDFNFYDYCHEHVMYYSLETIEKAIENAGLQIFDVSTNFVNGGSLRVFISHKEKKRNKTFNYLRILKEEEEYKLNDLTTYEKYAKKIEKYTKKCYEFVSKEVKSGGEVIGLGASTKGNVLLQLCNIDKNLMPQISERNPEKVGLRTLGLDMELISEEEARNKKPSAMFVLPWNFKEEIVAREKEYIDNGGKMLFAMPYPYVLDKDGEHRL